MIDLEAMRQRAGEYALLRVTKDGLRDDARYQRLAHELAVDAIKLIEWALREEGQRR